MKKITLLMAVVLSFAMAAGAQNKLNESPDSILGEYLVPDPGNDSKVRFTKNADGTFDGQVFWLESNIDPSTGQPWLDFRNPDKSLRNVRCDQLFIVRGLKYDARKKVWNGAKIYDPNRGIKANVTCEFDSNGQLRVRGSVLGIGETQHWKKLK